MNPYLPRRAPIPGLTAWNAANKRARAAYREASQEAIKERPVRRCPDCGAPLKLRARRCDPCRVKAKQASRDRYHAKRKQRP